MKTTKSLHQKSKLNAKLTKQSDDGENPNDFCIFNQNDTTTQIVRDCFYFCCFSSSFCCSGFCALFFYIFRKKSSRQIYWEYQNKKQWINSIQTNLYRERNSQQNSQRKEPQKNIEKAQYKNVTNTKQKFKLQRKNTNIKQNENNNNKKITKEKSNEKLI